MRFGELKRGLTLVLLMKRGLPRSKKKKKMMIKRALTLVLLMKSGLKWYVQRKCESGKVPLDPIDQGGPSKIQAKNRKKKDANK